MSNPLKYFSNRKVGLALGSGGAKGLSHVAVIEYLESMAIPIDMIAGSSIGAVVGALYCTGQLKRFKEDMLRFTLREMLSLMDPVVPRSGLMQGKGFVKFMERYIPPHAMVEELDPPLAILATDYASGDSMVFRSGSVLETLRASVSIPGVLVPVRYGERILVDGGLANPLPINTVREMGAGLTIAVNLHPQLKKWGLKKTMKERAIAPDLPGNSERIEVPRGAGTLSIPQKGSGTGWLKAIEKWVLSDKSPEREGLPNIFEIIAQSVDIMEYVNTMLILRFNAPTVLIEPDLIDVMTMNFTEASRIITEGYNACVRMRGALYRKVKARV
ncbi:MAG: patatin-like phospholipase family protein [Spirochaetes bacterium]|nr:patatin-like phospholipase family protein [Spirochaetota bacterium]